MKVVGGLMIVGLTCGFVSVSTIEHKNYLKMSKEEIMKTPVSELAELPFDQLMTISDLFSYSE